MLLGGRGARAMAGEGESRRSPGGGSEDDVETDLVLPSGSSRRVTDALENERAQWFDWTPVLLGIGIGIYFSLDTEPDWVVAAAPLVLAVVLGLARPLGLPKVIAIAFVLVAAGAVLAKVRTEWVRAPVIEKRMGPLEVAGFVELVEPRPTRSVRITLRVAKFGELPAERRPARVRIRTLGETSPIKPGDPIRVKATLAAPAAPVIPGGYDFARAAWFLGIGGVGYTLRAPEPDPSLGPPPAALAWSNQIESLRQAIGARVKNTLPGETGAIANALITGERGGISDATNDAFRASGLFHILSISGLHMVIMAGAVFYLARLLLAGIPTLALRYPIKKWAAAFAAVAALAYLLISGAAFATVRSYIMITIAFLAILIDRPAIAMRNVAIAALVILALYPESLLDVGFQMSFAAVVALVATYEWLSRRRTGQDRARPNALMRPLMFLGGIALSTVVAGLAVAPLAAYHFHTSQQFAVLANLVAIPICNMVVMPAALLTLVLMPLGLEGPALWVMGWGIEAVVACARYAAQLPGAVGHISAMPMAAFLVMVAGGLWACLWKTRLRLVGFIAIAAGGAMSLNPRLPDLIAGRDGTLLAVRGGDGLLSAAGAKRSDFELTRWLEHDGDARKVDEAARSSAFRCDGVGCVTTVKGVSVALARRPAALDDDCARAAILVLDFPAPRGCTVSGQILDFFKLRNEGTHSVYIDGPGSWRIETVASARGVRPWSPRQTLGAPRNAAARAPAATVAVPPAPKSGLPPRPEFEDEDQSEPQD